MIEFTYQPGLPWLLAGGLAVAGLLYWSYRAARGQANQKQRWLLFALRCVTIAVVIVCLLDPQRVREVKHFRPSYVAVLLDTSRSMNWKEDAQTRIDSARAWIKQRLAVPANFAVQVFGFSSNLVALPAPEAATATGSVTATADALEALLTQSAANPPASVVLLSDGADNSLKSPEPIARAYAQKKIPIHTVLLGRTNEPPDIIVDAVRIKSPVPLQSLAKATVTLRAPGFAGKTLPLRLTKDGKTVVETRAALAGERQLVDLEFAPAAVGFQTYKIEIPPQPGERLQLNNQEEFGVAVTDRPLRVVYMEGSGAYGSPLASTTTDSGKPLPLYLKNAVEATPGISVKTLYCEQFGAPPALNTQVAFVDPKSGYKIYRVQHPTQGFPKTLEELLKYDVIINSDIPKEVFSPQQLENAARFVTEFGGGFVMIGGHTAYGSGGYERTIIDRIIPMAIEQERDLTQSTFKPVIPPAAWSHPLLHLGATDAENQAIWTTKFPQLRGFNRVDRAKPGAIVLLEHPSIRTAHGPAVILAAQEVGKGRALAFTSDTTYWWGELFETIWGEPINPSLPLTEVNCDSRYFQRFWVNAVRWLAAHKLEREMSSIT